MLRRPPAVTRTETLVPHPTLCRSRARAQAIDAANVQMTDPMALAGLVANRAIFGAQPYGHVLEGTPASLAALKRGDITAAYTKGWQPADVTLVMVGDVTPAAAKALAEQQFGAWKAAKSEEHTSELQSLMRIS